MTTEIKFDRAEKTEIEAALKKAEIDLPAGWGKMSLDRKRRWAQTAWDKHTASLKSAGSTIGGALARGVKSLFAKKTDRAVVEKIRKAREKATMPQDKNWRRRPPGTRGKAWAAGYYAATVNDSVVENPSRQVLRAAKRRAPKMPLGMSTAKWHRQKGYGAIHIKGTGHHA